jgi:GWxTD domain-containing protein
MVSVLFLMMILPAGGVSESVFVHEIDPSSVAGTTVSGSPGEKPAELDEQIAAITSHHDDPYKAGLVLHDTLGIPATLEYWEWAYEKMLGIEQYDPRIGFRFVEYTVAAMNVERYQLATEMYFWGLRADFLDEFEFEVMQEILMMEPLLERSTFQEWTRLHRDRDPRLFQEMREFWIRKNMVPSSDQNERLLEHWQRIHYSREHFTNDESTVYGTDERALIYIRFGPPDRHRSGVLSYNPTEIQNRIFDLVEMGLVNVGQTRSLQMNIMQNYSPGRFDLWRYDRISDDGPIIFLFGRPGREGRYRLLDSLDDFINSSGYRAVVVGRRGTQSAFRAGYFLQMMLYNEASTLDHYFSRQYMDYERRWNQAVFQNNVNARLLGDLLSPQLAAHDMQNMQNRAPLSQSIYERRLAQYTMLHRQYRFFDEDMNPVTCIVLFPPPRLSRIGEALNKHEDLQPAGFMFRQGLNMYRKGERLSQHLEEHISLLRELASSDNELFKSMTLPLSDEDVRFQVFSEFYLLPDPQLPVFLGNNLVGVSREWTEASKAIENDGSLVISDLVLGTTNKKPVRIKSVDIGVLSNNEISPDEELQIFFEVYNLKPNEAGEYRYNITYRLNPEQRRRFFRRSTKKEVTLSWDAVAEKTYDHQHFEVDLSNAQSGKYRLDIIVEDYESGERYQRTHDLEIK